MTMAIDGDPASCSSLALALHRAAAALRADADRVTIAVTQAREDLGGRSGTALRRRSDALAEECRAAGEVLAAAARDLQHHASDLAEATGRARALTDLAERNGLRTETTGVVPQWGITGEADAARTAEQWQVASQIEAELTTLRVQVTRRRDELAAAMATARGALAHIAASID